MIDIGVDEAGRGCLFGPVVAGAVVLKNLKGLESLTDSKKLSPTQRDRLYEVLIAGDHMVGVGIAEASEIDEINILQASFLAMRRAISDLKIDPASKNTYEVKVDGKFKIPNLESEYSQEAIIKGDLKHKSIAAASVIAKVTRDRLVLELDKTYPGYGLSKHKGYPTKEHKDALQRLGASKLHRTSFRGVNP